MGTHWAGIRFSPDGIMMIRVCKVPITASEFKMSISIVTSCVLPEICSIPGFSGRLMTSCYYYL
ncbi:MAG: hypothetical protein C0616_03340 [Desulfuromonas sp.]|nr:MAG: hypothetical protein C0616_03340 [Desulfuromonas sp.]